MARLGSPFCFCSTIDLQREPRVSKSEELDVHEWAWDEEFASHSISLHKENREICFHPSYSSGTAAIRGDTPCLPGYEYYWEIKMLTQLYGTDVMVGVGTKKVDLLKASTTFCSLLGADKESWGFSYTGTKHHNGKWEVYGKPFGRDNIIGTHLDMWEGKLSFFLNRKPLGVAYTSLQGYELYPMVCSTAAQSGMRVIYSYSCPSSLQLRCIRSLSMKPLLLSQLKTIPGLKTLVEKYFWWLTSEYDDDDLPEDEPFHCIHDTDAYLTDEEDKRWLCLHTGKSTKKWNVTKRKSSTSRKRKHAKKK